MARGAVQLLRTLGSEPKHDARLIAQVPGFEPSGGNLVQRERSQEGRIAYAGKDCLEIIGVRVDLLAANDLEIVQAKEQSRLVPLLRLQRFEVRPYYCGGGRRLRCHGRCAQHGGRDKKQEIAHP